jgi:uncharacterized membrane protein
MKNVKQQIKAIVHDIWSLFLSGLLMILPLTLTIALFHFSCRLILGWVQPVKRFLPDWVIDLVPYSEFFVVITVIFLLGAIVKIFILHSIVHRIEKAITSLPLIRPIYTGIKQLTHAFSNQDKITFKQVVYVEFPRVGIHSIGFVTSELPIDIAPHKDQKYYNVFIPTTPNPTSGFFIVAPESAIELVDITRHEAMAMIISGGIIQPERFMEKEK